MRRQRQQQQTATTTKTDLEQKSCDRKIDRVTRVVSNYSHTKMRWNWKSFLCILRFLSSQVSKHICAHSLHWRFPTVCRTSKIPRRNLTYNITAVWREMRALDHLSTKTLANRVSPERSSACYSTHSTTYRELGGCDANTLLLWKQFWYFYWFEIRDQTVSEKGYRTSTSTLNNESWCMSVYWAQ